MRKNWFKVVFCSFLISFIIVLMLLTNNGFHRIAQAADAKELVVQTWGGASLEGLKIAFFEPFKKETGIKIIPVVATGDLLGKVAAQVRSGHIEWDVAWPADIAVTEAAASKGMWEEIDYDIVTNTNDLIPMAATKWGVGFTYLVYVITYNNKVFPGDNIPKSWADFYDVKKFPGPRANHTRWGGPVSHFLSALLADGVPADKLVPIDWDRAFKVLDRIKPHVKVWYSSGDKVMQVLIEEEVVLANTTDNRATKAKELGAKTGIQWNQGLGFQTYWTVVKGAPHKKEAMQFINFTTRPEQQAIYSKHVTSSCVNPKEVNFIDHKFQKGMAIHPDNFKKQIPMFTDKTIPWFIEHNDEMNERWNTWISE